MLIVFYKIGALFRGIVIHIVHSLFCIFCRIYLKTVNCIISLLLHKIEQRSRYKQFLGLYLVFLISVLCVSTCVCVHDSRCAQQPDTPESSGVGDVVCHLTWVLARSSASLCKSILTTLKTTFREKKVTYYNHAIRGLF